MKKQTGKESAVAPACLALLVRHCPLHQKAASMILSQGICQGCQLDPW